MISCASRDLVLPEQFLAQAKAAHGIVGVEDLLVMEVGRDFLLCASGQEVPFPRLLHGLAGFASLCPQEKGASVAWGRS